MIELRILITGAVEITHIFEVLEDAEGKETILLIEKMLRELLDIDEATPIEIERAYRTLATKPKSPNAHPRAFVLCLLNFQTKQNILRWAHERGELKFTDKRISIYPDISAELLRKRKEYDGIKKALLAKRIRYSLLHLGTTPLDRSAGRMSERDMATM
ncbi:hypothetical protein EOD39_11254 [Acipenser ruthenus]|uniref:Uncharacterized protein n=1 Tax=Acipenser ruthenus TaxID=7906 RepID=A0A444UPE4_ACIRT|nr:hypothetical protein EOD39_11254 [Acipenser ruthenus]